MSTGIILFFDEENRAERLQEYIEAAHRFSDALSLPDWGMHERSIALIGFDSSHFHYAALARRGKRVATLKFLVEFTHFIDLGPLPLQDLASELRSSIRPHFIRVSSGQGQPVPRQTWQDTLSAIRRLRPHLSHDLDWLEDLAAPQSHEPLDRRQEQLAQEKDALLLARQIFGFDSRRDPLSWSRRASQDIEIPSFLAVVDASRVIEDTFVQHDRDVFGIWRLLERFHVGAVQFARGKERLTVVTANRTPLEHSLGVDLIYWHHRYRSFTMVQYKRMVKEGHRKRHAVYRPSGSYERELQHMLATLDKIRASQGRAQYPLCTEYRLNTMPFFFKLCHLSEFDHNDQGLVPGMYIPLDYWEILLTSDGVTGKRGGKALTYENVGRYLNNTEFVLLVQSGWVGSCGMASTHLADLISNALSSGRALDFAWSQEEHS